MERQSVWTGRRSAHLIEVSVPSLSRLGRPTGDELLPVEPEHEAELRRFIGYVRRYARLALMLVGVGVVLMLIGSMLSIRSPSAGLMLVALGTLLLGLTVIVFPFATPETVAWIGFRRSQIVVRIGGLMLIGLALWICLIAV